MTVIRIILAKLAGTVVALYVFVAVAAVSASGSLFYILQLVAAMYVARLAYRRIRSRLDPRSSPAPEHRSDGTHIG